MPRALSLDLRERILEAWQGGVPWEDIAGTFRVGIATVNRVIGRYRRTGSVEPRPHGGGQPAKIPDEDLPNLRALVERHPDATLAEYVELYAEETGVRISCSTVGRAFKRLRITRKKRLSRPRSSTARRSR